MEPVDFRNATYEELQARLTGLRLAALSAWRQHGPGTTRDVAQRAGMDLLTFRPRSTELYQLGFLRLENEQEGGHEGIYAARSDDELRAFFEQQHRAAIAGYQPELKLQ